ncbi:hypothetical protein FQN50_000442 [Emmonsiellopsis sp. PD_5]|nr:hypothetical protein FQN50_000442 [Emmonsiellopsis sp. PD_5]
MVIYGPAAFFTKASILLILTRVFAPFRNMVIFIYAYSAVLLAYYIPAIIVKVRICMPISHFWLGGSSEGSCLDERAIILADAIMSVLNQYLGENSNSNAEVSIGIICACLPALAALLGRKCNEYGSRNASGDRDCELGGTSTLTGSVSKLVQSRGSFNEGGSEHRILPTHKQGDIKVETAIEADVSKTANGSHRAAHSFTGHGIMRTVDVSHTVTTKEEVEKWD